MVLDPFSTSIVISLIANGFTMLVSYGVEKVKKIVKCRGSIQKALEADTVLISTIQNVMAKIAKTPVLRSSELQATRMQLFLESPTAESIIRQIYSNFLPGETQQKSTEQLQKEFQICLAYHLGVNTDNVKQLAKDIFEVISMGCRKVLSLAIDQGILSAHEAKSIARHRILLDELKAIKSNLDFLVTHSDLDLNAIKDFEKQYRQQVGGRYSQITIPHFDQAPRIDINRIFISPSFVYTPKKKGTEPETISMDRFLTKLYRVVLLGDPGGGKSTLAQKICYDLSKNYEKRFVDSRLLTPVLVVLREYSSKKKQEGVSIIQFMESEVTSKYQLPKGAPLGAFEYLLNNGHLLVIFDGLDELLDPSYRREISADIESFCNLFPSVLVLVTSRIVGYEQAPLSPNRFETSRIEPFDNEQVSEYAEKWFANDPTLSRNKGKRHANSFLEESRIVSDLRSNPLMLALMCNLYRGAGFIPRNRPEVYKKCSEMLLERWDPSRGIWVHLPIPEPKFLLSHLAHWIYSDELLQSGVPENILTKEATKFLLSRRFETEEEAEKAAKEFIEFCRGRAWVFTDAGTTPEGISLYKFTHKTFLEYFTAANIVRNNNTPEKLWGLLGPRIKQRAWDMVAQLAFQMLHEQVEGASDELLILLIQDAQKKKEARWPYLSFGARCLQFIYPSPKTIRALTEATVRCVIDTPPSRRRESTWHRFPLRESEELIRALLFAALECRPMVADSLQSEIVNYSNNRDNKVAIRAIDLGLMLDFPLHRFGRGYPVEQELYEYWNAVSKKIFEQVDERLRSLATHNFLAFTHWFNRNDGSVEKLFAWYAPDNLFLQQQHIIFENVFTWSIAQQILMYLPEFDVPVEKQISKKLKRVIKSASEIGKILLNKSLPCFSYRALQNSFQRAPDWSFYLKRSFTRRPESMKGPKVTVSISSDVIIGAWCLWATIAEVIEKHEKLVSQMKRLQNPVINAISDVIGARMHRITSDKALGNLKRFNLPQTALEFVERWINGQVSFVRPRGRGKVKMVR